MKQFFTLLVALVATVSAFAGEIILTPAGLTAQTSTDINVTVQGVTLKYYGSLTADDFRLFAKQGNAATNDLTISYAKNITKVEIIGTTKGASDGSDIKAAPGTISATAGASTQVGQTVEITIDNINATALTISVVKQLRMQQIKLTVEGEVEGGGNEGGNEGGNQGGSDPINPSDTLTVAQAIAIAKGAPGNTQYIVKGYVTYSYGYKEQYGNIDLFISDTPDGGQDFEIFRATLVNGEPQVGDLVVGTGNITTFVKGDGTTIYEITNGTVEILEKGEGGGNQGGEEEDEWSYEWEDPTPMTFNETMTYAEGITLPLEDGMTVGAALVYLENNNNWAELYFNTHLASSTDPYLPTGTYAINDSGDANTVYSSRGATFDYDDPSYFAAIEGEYYYGYYLTSGTVTVSRAGDNYTITVAAQSYHGSTINLNYTGPIVWSVDTAVDNVTVTESNTHKVLQGGHIYILRDGIKYNVLGTQVK